MDPQPPQNSASASGASGNVVNVASTATGGTQRMQQQKKKSGRGSSKTFSMAEKLHLLGIMKEILPTDGNEWDEVLHQHNVIYHACERDVPKLRRKFTSLYRTKIPSGDPHMPEDVRLAKHIRHLITAKNSISCGDEDVIEVNNNGNIDDEDDDDEENDDCVTGEFARPNTQDQDELLVLEDAPTIGLSLAPGNQPSAQSTTQASSHGSDRNQSSTTSVSSAETSTAIQAARRTPRKGPSIPGLTDILQLQMAAMTEARERHERYLAEERERRNQEREDRKQERQELLETISTIAKAYFESKQSN
jgi:hypothetical protein